jgi:hypothetical protein
VQINLGKHAEPVDSEDQCFWVPSTTRHEVRKDDTTGLTRYSFFVYGGVNLQPRINVVQRGNAALRGNPVGRGSFNRSQITKGFQDHHIASHSNKYTKNHELFQLSGINVHSRVNKIYLPENASLHESRSIHYKRHTSTYSEKVSWRMDGLVEQGKAAGWTQQQYRDKTRKLLSELRQELRAGNIGLNKHHRPWATKW